MNVEKLIHAKKRFLEQYPGGFDDPRMDEIRKKHKPGKMHEMALEYFAPECFDNPSQVLENMVKVISRASMVSVFEKPKFRDFAKEAFEEEVMFLTMGLKNFLYGDRETGFNMMEDVLRQHKLAKWTLLTICPYYYKPTEEVFIKPTTVKSGISFFELEGLAYSAKPTYEFYIAYKDAVDKMKKIVNVTDDNAAFGGFIMITTGI